MNNYMMLDDIAKKFGMNILVHEYSSATINAKQSDDNLNARSINDATFDSIVTPMFPEIEECASKGFCCSFTPNGHMRTRDYFRHFITKWPFRQQSDKPAKGIAVAGKDSFSPAFDDAIGRLNTRNIFGLDDGLVMEAIFETLLEREASSQHHSSNNQYLHALLNINEGWNNDGISVHGQLRADGELEWHLNSGIISGTSWVDLLCAVFNLPRMDALATLANILSMSFDNLSKLSSDRHTAESRGTFQQLKKNIPEVLHLSELPAGAACVELIDRAYIYGNAGQTIGAILRYRFNENDFCLPATVGRGELCMGKYKPTAHFLNQHLMDQHPFAPTIFFQDMRTALAFERMLGETQGYDPKKFIVTAHLGTDLSVLPWNYFYSHDVVFVPAPTKVCMAMVKLYRDYIMGTSAQSFRIYPGFLLHSPPNNDLKECVEGIADAEEELLRGTVWLDTIERSTWLMEQVAKKGVSYDDFVDWGQKLGIFKAPKEQSSDDMATPSNSLSLFQPYSGPAAPQLTSIEDVTTREIFVSGGISLLHGLKDSGKSIACIAAAKAILTGRRLFDVISSGEVGNNILYIDSETPQTVLAARLAQFGLTEEVIARRLFLLSKFDHKATDFAFSIQDQVFREHVEKILHEKSCRYLVLDNLTSLMDDGSLYQATAVSQLFNWLETLAQQGFSIILVNHTREDASSGTAAARTRGSQEFSIRAHTEIVLVRSTEILEKKLGTEAVQHAAAQDGLTVGISFKVCKAACVLQKKTFWLHLPLGASEWQFLAATGADGTEITFLPLADEPAESTVSTHDASAPSKNVAEAELGELSEKERLVYEYAKSHEEVSTKDVKTQLGCGDTQAREILQGLSEKGILVRNNKNGPATAYQLNK